ncbi:MAG: hypothetical protein U9Q83_07670 [Bacteroidota bacterium]|nr:hypothetical protein [Bacteroidota bacterium]
MFEYKMMDLGVKGGQNSNGSQKDGFLKYEKGKPVAIYDVDKKEYVAIDSFKSKIDTELGEMPKNTVAWKSTLRMRNKDEVLAKMFDELSKMNTLGAKLSKLYMDESRRIGQLLVDSKVAKNTDDVNTVLMTGFFHAYGPINDYLK